jgi:hypothetical protein
MSIQTIEIICIPCDKCEKLKANITEIIHRLELQNKTKIYYEFKHTPHLRDIANYSLNPSQTPALLINGSVEMAGTIDRIALKSKLEAIHKY